MHGHSVTEYHFTGKERDTESGNDYFEARYYSSNMGRFMSPDWAAKEEPVPYANLDDPQSLNLYAYVRNNLLSRVDVDGHQEPDRGCKDGMGFTQEDYSRMQTAIDNYFSQRLANARANLQQWFGSGGPASTGMYPSSMPNAMFSKDAEAGNAIAGAKGATKETEGTNREAEEALSSGAATGKDAEKLAQHVGEQKAGIEATKSAVGALAGAKGKDAKQKALQEVNKQTALVKGHTKDIDQQLNHFRKSQ